MKSLLFTLGVACGILLASAASFGYVVQVEFDKLQLRSGFDACMKKLDKKLKRY